ncbi:MAG: pantoate--beta-alanine ligase [Candidatus Omnitrophica bacterium]|nr:pantoate--beta-alanine ligase [Candidatus Omnitrophota bacterium]
MKIIRSIKEMQAFSLSAKRKGGSIGFVPTMGALHEGHLSLIRRAKKENDIVVVSIFVNPAQFGPREDFEKYPRNLKKDAQLCEKEGVDIVFYPSAKQMYPEGFKTYVEVEELSEVLCGRSRPTHFRGVATVVAKLFNIVSPEIAYFGAKDAQQAIIIRRMAQDLNLPLKIKVMPIVREKDGLALSSRNVYLNPDERKSATVLYKAVREAADLAKKKISDPRYIIQRMKQIIRREKCARIDYIAIVNMSDLKPVKKIEGKVLLALAVYIGKTRLIDNIIINV